MEPLDLSTRPPRSPRISLGGLLMMARTLDKARALLPGGNPGRYYITPGLSAWLLGKLGFGEKQFLGIVAQAQCEDEVVARFGTRLPEEKREKINRFITRFTLNDVPEEMQRHILAAHPWGFDESLPVIEVLEEDDRRSLPGVIVSGRETRLDVARRPSSGSG